MQANRKVIELTESMREKKGLTKSLELQSLRSADEIAAQEVARARLVRVLLIVAVACGLALLSIGCTVSASTCSSLRDEPQDGGYEPIGWGMTQDIGTAEESYRAKR